MKQEWQKLFESMQQDINLCLLKQLDPETEIECCFQIGMNYWSLVEKDMGNGCFLSTDEEMDFYKHVKPLFVSHIEYYNLLYHAALFKPVNEPGIKEFWIREAQRLDKFILDHKEFYEYYKSGDTSDDERYFLSGDVLVNKDKPVYRDEWVATLLALEKYQDFIKKELNSL